MANAKRRRRTRHIRKTPGITTLSGLGSEHQRTRKIRLAEFVDGDPCPYGRRCLHWPNIGMHLWQGLDLGDIVPRVLGGAAYGAENKRLEHADCNRHHGARLGNMLRKRGAVVRVPTRTSRW